jgi:hypothetical protein
MLMLKYERRGVLNAEIWESEWKLKCCGMVLSSKNQALKSAENLQSDRRSAEFWMLRSEKLNEKLWKLWSEECW